MKEFLNNHFTKIIVGLIWLTTIILVSIPQTTLEPSVLSAVNGVVGVVFGAQLVVGNKDKDNKDK